MMAINKKLYERNLLYNEQKFHVLMGEINQHYSALVNEMNGEVSTVDTGKLISLVAAIMGLIILVLEPAFKKGEKNYKDLQNARNELLNEKKPGTYPWSLAAVTQLTAEVLPSLAETKIE